MTDREVAREDKGAARHDLCVRCGRMGARWTETDMQARAKCLERGIEKQGI